MRKIFLFSLFLIFCLESYPCVGPLTYITKDTTFIISNNCCGNVIEDGLLGYVDKLNPVVSQGSLFLTGAMSFDCCNSASLKVLYSDTLVTISKISSDTGKICTCLCYNEVNLNFQFKSDKIHVKFGSMDTIISKTNSIIHLSNNFIFQVMPNPTTGILNVKTKGSDYKNYTFSLFDIVGNKVSDFKLNAFEENIIDVNLFKSGLYLYKLQDIKGIIKEGKLIINTH